MIGRFFSLLLAVLPVGSAPFGKLSYASSTVSYPRQGFSQRRKPMFTG